MGRSELDGVAAGLAGSFVSRNNDVDGYWGVGLLRLFADQHQLQTLRFDLAEGLTEQMPPSWFAYATLVKRLSRDS